MKVGQSSAFYWIVVTGAGEWNDPLFTSVGVNDQTLKARRDDFIIGGEKKNGGHVTRAGVRHAVEFGRNFERHRTGEEPEIPPAELPEDDLPQGRRIMQNQARDFSVRGNVKRSRCSEAGAENDYRMVAGYFLQFVKRGQRRRS